MKSVFTIFWALKLNFDSTCVYLTSYIFDFLLFLWFAPFGFGLVHGRWSYWPFFIYFIISFACLLMAVFAIVQLITMKSSGPSRQASYAKARLWLIIGLVITGIILFVIFMTYSYSGYKTNVESAISISFPLIFTALFAHSYHANWE